MNMLDLIDPVVTRILWMGIVTLLGSVAVNCFASGDVRMGSLLRGMSRSTRSMTIATIWVGALGTSVLLSPLGAG